MGLFGPPNVDKMKAKRDVKGLIKALGYQKDGSVRKAAAQALVDTGDAMSATWALREMRDAQAMEPLTIFLKDKNSDVRVAAAQALDRLGWQPGKDQSTGKVDIATLGVTKSLDHAF